MVKLKVGATYLEMFCTSWSSRYRNFFHFQQSIYRRTLADVRI